MTTAAGTAAVLLLGRRNVRSGALTLGELLMVMTYLPQLYGPLQTISKTVGELPGARSACAGRAFALLDRAGGRRRPDARPSAGPPARSRSTASTSAYDGVRPDAARRLVCGRRRGRGWASSGRTGAGKTTLISLLTRFYDPAAGRILLDGVDLRDYRLADLRGQFALVLQEPVLFSATIAENIAYAVSAPRRDEIVAAARAANAARLHLAPARGVRDPRRRARHEAVRRRAPADLRSPAPS